MQQKIGFTYASTMRLMIGRSVECRTHQLVISKKFKRVSTITSVSELLQVNVRNFCFFFTGEYFISGDILAVGYYTSHKKAEVLNTERNTWLQIEEYPYATG